MPHCAPPGRRTGAPRATCFPTPRVGPVFALPSSDRRSSGTNDMDEGATMARRTGWSLLAAAAATLIVAGACNGGQSPRPHAVLGLPAVGALAVTVAHSRAHTSPA